MFNDDADRTLPPTERKRREARLRGQVARSSELTSAVVLLATGAVLWWLAPQGVAEIVKAMRTALTVPPSTELTIPSVVGFGWHIGQVIGTFLIPAAIIVFASAVIANLIQTGWMWTPTKLVPQFRWSGLISWDRSFDVVGLIIRFAVLGTVTSSFLSKHRRQFMSFGVGEPNSMFAGSVQLIGELIFQLAFCLIVLAIFDYGFRFWQNEIRLKMTVEERRREQQDEAVDPRIKRKRDETRGRFESTLNSVEPIEGNGR